MKTIYGDMVIEIEPRRGGADRRSGPRPAAAAPAWTASARAWDCQTASKHSEVGMTKMTYRVTANISLKKGLQAEFHSSRTFLTLAGAVAFIGNIESSHPETFRYRFELSIEEKRAIGVWVTVPATEWRYPMSSQKERVKPCSPAKSCCAYAWDPVECPACGKIECGKRRCPNCDSGQR
jgi:hypothetical protein